MSRALLFSVLVFSACATVRPPSGGEKDVIAPELASSSPTQASVDFRGDRVILEFNERIQLNAPSKNVLISPPLVKKPDIRLTGSKELSIIFKETLRENTTYTINLSEAVGDLTENNKAKNTSFVFSTGPVLDSLKVSGAVIDALTLDPILDAKVILLPLSDSANISEQKPYYLAISDASGLFQLNNLKEGSYQAFALSDQNGNSIYDLPNEGLAFKADNLVLPDSSFLELAVSIARAKEQVLLDKSINAQHALQLIMSLPADSINISTMDDIGKASVFLKTHRSLSDTVIFWPTDTTLLNGRRLIIDSAGTPLDTIVYRPKGKLPFHIAPRLIDVNGNIIRFSTSRPYLEVDTSLFTWYPDSLGKCQITSVERVSELGFRIVVNDIRGKAIRLMPGAVTGYFDSRNDTLTATIESIDPASLGSVMIELKTLDEKFNLIELIGPQGKVLDRRARSSTLTWKDLSKGDYRVRAIADLNKNGIWDPGDYESKLQPEKVLFFPEDLIVRAGWKLELQW